MDVVNKMKMNWKVLIAELNLDLLMLHQKKFVQVFTVLWMIEFCARTRWLNSALTRILS